MAGMMEIGMERTARTHASPFTPSRHARLAAGDLDVVTTSRWYFYTGPMPSPETPEEECRVFSGTANPELSAELASFLGRPLDSIDGSRCFEKRK